MKNIRQRAIDLRRRGWSYNIISQRLSVAKSTLSHWLREIPYEPNEAVVKRIRLGPARAAANKQRQKIQQIETFRERGLQEIGRVDNRDLWLLGLGVYLGEGSKLYETVRVINSDPQVIRVAMQWFRRICRVPERNFAIAVHLYPDTSPERAIAYWSHITGLPRKQFERIQVDRRLGKSGKKRRRLPYGTAHIKIYSRGDRHFGVQLHRRIMGWIGATYKRLRA